jgi:hypothetical protein
MPKAMEAVRDRDVGDMCRAWVTDVSSSDLIVDTDDHMA